MRLLIPLWCVVLSLSCGQDNGAEHRLGDVERDTCDNPDAHVNCAFIGMPATLDSLMVIADMSEPGERLTLSGRLLGSDSMALPGAILYAYHTDGSGLYSKTGDETGARKWHGRLHGWCLSDASGRYRMQTIRPAPYPDGTLPAHIHAAVRPRTGRALWITDFVFADDPLVDAAYVSRWNNPVGGDGVVHLRRTLEGLVGERDIVIPEP